MNSKQRALWSVLAAGLAGSVIAMGAGAAAAPTTANATPAISRTGIAGKTVCTGGAAGPAARFSVAGIVPGMTAEQARQAICAAGPAPVWRPKDWYLGSHEDYCLGCSDDNWWKPVDLVQTYGSPTIRSIRRERKFETWVTAPTSGDPVPRRFREVSPQALNRIAGDFTARHGQPNFTIGSGHEVYLAWVMDNRGQMLPANHWTDDGDALSLNDARLLPLPKGFMDSTKRVAQQRARMEDSDVRATYCLANFSTEFQPFTEMLPLRGLPWLEGEIAKGLRGEIPVPGATATCGTVLLLRISIDMGYRNGRDIPLPVPNMLPMVSVTVDVRAALSLPVPVIGYTVMMYDAAAQSRLRMQRARS